MSVRLTIFSLPLICLGVAASEIPPVLLSEFKPLPQVMTNPANPQTPAKVALGKMLYFEPRISRDQKISCNSCHDLARYGVDNQATSTGFRSQHGDRNSPTTLNAAAHFLQFWDGRAPDVEAQASGPMMNPVEMAAPSPVYVATVLKSMPEYVEAFQKAFPGQTNPVTITNAAAAIGVFERTLVTPARWDKFLAGDTTALTETEKNGFMKFVQKGCNTCHTGVLLGGHEFRKLGAMKPWPDKTDLGRAKVTRDNSDDMMFKVPSLRNVAKTGPYLHNGSITDLTTIVMKMGEFQTGKKLSKDDASAILVWLDALTGTLPAEVMQTPKLPASTPTTPKPEV